MRPAGTRYLRDLRPRGAEVPGGRQTGQAASADSAGGAEGERKGKVGGASAADLKVLRSVK